MSSTETSSQRSWRSGAQAIRLLQSGAEGQTGRAHGSAPTADGATRPSREELLKACARGEQRALHSLYLITAPQLFGIALNILKNRELAQDILQDCFVRIWRHAHRFDPGRGTAMAWLARIIRNRCFDILRERRREAPLNDAVLDDWEDPASSPFDLLALTQDARRLGDCLEQLDTRPRKAIMMAYYEGITYRDVADRIGVPVSTVKTWIRRGLMRLRVCMET